MESRDTSEASESEDASLRARFGAGADAGVCAWAARAAAMCRRMDVMLLTLSAASAERDPGKRLEVRVLLHNTLPRSYSRSRFKSITKVLTFETDLEEPTRCYRSGRRGVDFSRRLPGL